MRPSPKQSVILAALRQRERLTLSEAVELIGGDIYTNQAFHVGNILSRMVKRGMIRRIKPGLFCLETERPAQLPLPRVAEEAELRLV
jgi:predicted transcriptional regulator of viral defense system